MQKKLTITIDEDVHAALYRVVGRGKISGFIESLVRSHVIGDDRDSAHRENVSAVGEDMPVDSSLIAAGPHAAPDRMTTDDLDGQKQSIVELLAMPEAANIKFDPPRLDGELYRKPELP